jgi:hypothetical protein
MHAPEDLKAAVGYVAKAIAYDDPVVSWLNSGSSESTTPTLVMGFFLNLLRRLQTVGTMPAIDYSKYLTAL